MRKKIFAFGTLLLVNSLAFAAQKNETVQFSNVFFP
jgi:hypothetical protein